MLRTLELIGPPKWPVKKKANHMLLARAYVRNQRDQLMRVAVNALNSHKRRVEFGLAGTLSEAEVQDLKTYVQLLCDVPQQSGFPYNVVWPKTPDCLRGQVVG